MSRENQPEEWGTRDTPWSAPAKRVRAPRRTPPHVTASAATPRRRPPSHVVLAVLATAVSLPLLLGVPAGLVALVSAVRVLRSWRRDPELAEELSERARRWSWLAVLLTLMVFLGQLVVSEPASMFDG